MEVLAFDVNPAQDVDATAARVRYCSLPELLEQADFVSVNVNLSDSSRHLIGPAELGMMKKGAIIVNTSRGPVIDEAALYDALASGQIAAAGIDTFEGEREHTTRLSELPNTVLTPHMGGHTVEGTTRANMRAARNVVGVRQGRLDSEADLVNPGTWPRRLAGQGRFAGRVAERKSHEG
jgi:phosphoglycerate dehydrogenase-like enzyme